MKNKFPTLILEALHTGPNTDHWSIPQGIRIQNQTLRILGTLL
jgi:hypothetical protein